MQLIQNAVAYLASTPPDVTPMAPSYGQNHCKALTVAFRTPTGTVPSHLNSQVHALSHQLQSMNKQHLVLSQRGTMSFSKTFTFSASLWWNEMLTYTQTAETATTFQKAAKATAFQSELNDSAILNQCNAIYLFCISSLLRKTHLKCTAGVLSPETQNVAEQGQRGQSQIYICSLTLFSKLVCPTVDRRIYCMIQHERPNVLHGDRPCCNHNNVFVCIVCIIYIHTHRSF